MTENKQEDGYIKIKLNQDTLGNVIAYAAKNDYSISEAINFLLEVQLSKDDANLPYPKVHLHSEKIYRLEKTADNMMTLLLEANESNRKMQRVIAHLENKIDRLSQEINSTQ